MDRSRAGNMKVSTQNALFYWLCPHGAQVWVCLKIPELLLHLCSSRVWRKFMIHMFLCVCLCAHMWVILVRPFYFLWCMHANSSIFMCNIAYFVIFKCVCVCVSDLLCEWKIPLWSSSLSPQHSLSFFHSSLSSPCSSLQLFDTRLCVKQRKSWKYYMPEIVWRAFLLSPWQHVYNSLALRLYLLLKPPLIQSWHLVLCLSRVLVKFKKTSGFDSQEHTSHNF